MGNKNKITSREVDSKVIDLNSSESAGNRTVAIHFSTEHNNQFCDFTDLLLHYVKESKVSNGSLNLYTPHTTTSVSYTHLTLPTKA